jgi:hypothetical protein
MAYINLRELERQLCNRNINMLIQKIISDNYDNWPEDEWIAINDDLDINLWIDAESLERRAQVCPVINGSTDSSIFKIIKI